MNQEHAISIAIRGLAYIATDERQTERFLALTGVAADDVKKLASEPAFLAGVLEFYLGHEPTLLAFSAEADIPPEDIVNAYGVLAGSPDVS